MLGARATVTYFGGAVAPLVQAATCEFLAMVLFQLLAGSAGTPTAVAFVFSAIQYAFSFVSGTHISSTATLGATLSGYVSWLRAAVFLVAQALGALLGACLLVFMVPGYSFGQFAETTCHVPEKGVGGTQLFIWEALLCFLFYMALHSAILKAPGHGPVAPLTAGVTLYACLATAGHFTGYSPLNPAVTLASSIVFDCAWRYMWMYLLAQLTGAGLAAAVVVMLQGRGPYFTGELHEGDEAHGATTIPVVVREGYGGASAQEPAGGGGTMYEPLRARE